MPELPEVETVVRGLRSEGLPGRTVVGASVGWMRSVVSPSLRLFIQRVRGQSILEISRRGKFIVMRLEEAFLIVHLRMTGKLCLVPPHVSPSKHECLKLELDDQRELRFHDPRKFGRWWLVKNPSEILNSLGPEPLSANFSLEVFRKRLRAHRRQLKPLLLDQTFLAGLGNIYVDESLWRARLHPQRLSDGLSPAEENSLHRAIRRVLRQGIRFGGTSLGHGEGNFRGVHGQPGQFRTQLKVYQRAGQPCPRCGAGIRRLEIAQRGTHLCLRCQPGPP